MRLATQPTWVLALLVAGLAAAAAAGGMGSIPLDGHEIYVAQTAENMVAGGDWIVPRLNGELRLKKPPLSYWAVAGAAYVLGDQQVTPALARWPSVAAAIGMAVLALMIGLRLFDRRTALLGALITLSSVAFFRYAHNARPDMLYAFWCTAMLAAWVATAGPRDARRHWIWAFWAAAGLGTLTKGPQAPGILILGLITHALLAGERPGELWRRSRPLVGLALVALIALPWWWLLRRHVGPGALEDSQLSGELLAVNPLRLFSPFYLMRTPLLWLPWTLLLIPALARARAEWRGSAGLLVTALAVAILCFSMGPQYRQIYLLPWLVPAALWLAAGVTGVPWSRVLLWLTAGLAVVALGWLLWQASPAVLPLLLLFVVVIGAAFQRLYTRRETLAAMLMAAAFAAAWLACAYTPAVWSPERYRETAFIRALEPYVEAGVPIAAWDIGPWRYVYYLDREVAGFETMDALCAWLQTQAQPALLVYSDERRLASLRARVPLQPLPITGFEPFAAGYARQGCQPADVPVQ